MISLKNSYLAIAVLAFLLLFITYYFMFRKVSINKKSAEETSYEEPSENLDGIDTLLELLPGDYGTQKNVIYLGGLYRRKPKKHKKKKQSLNKNKYKKHRKPIK